MDRVDGWIERLRESAWFSLAGKGVLGVGALLVLGLVGSGALDRWVVAPPAMAASSARQRAAPEAASARAITSSTAAPSAPSPKASASASAPLVGGPSAMTSDGKVILNLATEVELVKLPGVGPKKAQAILALREKLGRFKRLEDLVRVRGIKRKFLDRLRPLVVIDPEPAAAGAPGK